MKNITKVLVLVALFLGFNSSVKSQVQFMHSAGITYSYLLASGGGSTVGMGVPGITYNPRLGYALNDKMSVCATTYLSLGVSGSANSQSGSSLAYGVELPLYAQFNWGHHATDDSDGGFGLFAAAGYNMGKIGNSNGSFKYSGPSVLAGAKFEIIDRSFGVRASYTFAGEGLKVFNFGALYNF